MARIALTRADCAIALRNAWEDAREYARTWKAAPSAYRFGLMLKYAYEQIRRTKAREAHKAAEVERQLQLAVEVAARRAAPAYVAPQGRWEGAQELLDMRTVAELEVLRFECADAFTFEGNLRLFEAKARLAEIEAQLTWRAVA